MRVLGCCILLTVLAGQTFGAAGTDVASLPLIENSGQTPTTDWLIDGSPYKAGVYRTAIANEIALDNGLIRRTLRLAPTGATVGFDNRMNDQALLRAVKPEAVITLDGEQYRVGGLTGQPDHAYLLPQWIDQLKVGDQTLRLSGFHVGKTEARFAWKRVRHHAPNLSWPPDGVSLRMDYVVSKKLSAAPAATPAATGSGQPPTRQPAPVCVSVHYELYDGIPLLSKWITVSNSTDKTVVVDRLVCESLAVVEDSNWVESRDGVVLPRPRSLHIETDMAFGGFQPANANRHVVHWRPDPEYRTQVNYRRETPCWLVVEPEYGPAQDVPPGKTFESFRTFELVYDSTDRERRGLALRRMYRTIAPWVTENPLMMHMRTARPDAVRHAIDQCAEVGFEMLILSFGSGFNIENNTPEYIASCRGLADHARSKGIEIGGYSLLASRRVGGGNDVVSPPGTTPTFGNCPALTSKWGQEYFGKLYAFFKSTGFMLLEHDGSYPGDVDVTARPPLQKGVNDSQWTQWRIISNFYKWCRGQGVYLNVPDYYYLTGSTKCGMGYRETNWSLPRPLQVIHTRQNIYDGTWTKTPSMGWMFVPLTQYHGGGAAATIEPLDEHRDHYERMLVSNLAMGVQACYRGPRLYDTDRTKALLAKWISWYKKYRNILESDMVHGRRADGRDLDWMLHVNPALEHKGLLVVFNPRTERIQKTLHVNLYYTGLVDRARIGAADGDFTAVSIGRDHCINVPVSIPAEGFSWYVIKE